MMTEKAYVKIIILAVYNAIGAGVCEIEVQESIISTGEVNAFDYREALEELVADGMLYQEMIGSKLVCGINEVGESGLKQAELLIKKSVLDSIVTRSLRHFEAIHTGRWYDTEMIEADGGWYVIFSQKSKTAEQVVSKLFFEDKNNAYKTYRYCQEKPEAVHNGIVKVMTGDIIKLIRGN